MATSAASYTMTGVADSEIIMQPVSLNGYTTISWSFWLYWNTLENNTGLMGDFGAGDDWYIGYFDNKYEVALKGSGGTFIVRTSDASLLAAGSWHHICFTWDGTADIAGWNAYFDGVLKGMQNRISTPSITISDNPTNISFGSRGNGSGPSDIKLAQVNFWDIELTQDQVKEVMYKTNSFVDNRSMYCPVWSTAPVNLIDGNAGTPEANATKDPSGPPVFF